MSTRKNASRFAKVDPALWETLIGIIETTQRLGWGVQGLTDLIGTLDWPQAREGVSKLRTALDDLDLELQTMERGADPVSSGQGHTDDE